MLSLHLASGCKRRDSVLDSLRRLPVWFLSLTILALSACGEREEGPPIRLEGRWAWADLSNCQGDRSVWAFDGNLWEVRRRGVVVERREFRMEQNGPDTVTILFRDGGDPATRRIRFNNSRDRFRFLAGTRNEAADPSVELQVGQVWLRCPPRGLSDR
jgi:hypothetical protein